MPLHVYNSTALVILKILKSDKTLRGRKFSQKTLEIIVNLRKHSERFHSVKPVI